MQSILFTDDNKNIREFCKRELEEEGYRVVLARDGWDAVRLFPLESPDLVILDICMPGINGLETIERLRAMGAEIPVIFFTGFDEDCARDPRGRLAAACVEKSWDLTELKRTIARLLTASETKQSLRLGLPPIGAH
jgi:two-component system, response regulator, stage 0 sporulation protein F